MNGYTTLELDGEDPRAGMDKARKKLSELADKLPPELMAKLEESMDQAFEEVLRDGAGVTSAKSLIAVMKDAGRTLEIVPKGLLALPAHLKKDLGKKSGLASAFVLGGIAADVISAINLIEDARKRLRDHLETECFEPGTSAKKAEPQPKPE